MPTFVPTLEARELAELADDVRELTKPWYRTIWQEWEDRRWDKNRNLKVRRHRLRVVQSYPPLLDTLRAAVHPGSSRKGPERRRTPSSRVLVSEGAYERLSRLQRELAAWARRLGLDPAAIQRRVNAIESDMTRISPIPGRWRDPEKVTLQALPGLAANLDAWTARELIRDVHRWWKWAAVHSGFRPEELLEGRNER
jgi:hypothetical protein